MKETRCGYEDQWIEDDPNLRRRTKAPHITTSTRRTPGGISKKYTTTMHMRILHTTACMDLPFHDLCLVVRLSFKKFTPTILRPQQKEPGRASTSPALQGLEKLLPFVRLLHRYSRRDKSHRSTEGVFSALGGY
ncbi:hypothetical protein L873DRAFT_1805445 [Choiromyces venosus 120613-1]|uniref:Uncharacterized protein n=1 Tax=Choiromyces venosus 120613-1 TaxID=1336337 RepID=A0A3N4JPR8_9PEZI|nr:hypothetical protein L873DRAFT_1805445 [Choiromyces venosus 120613-1]